MLMLSNVTNYNTIGRTVLFNHGVNARVRTKSIIILQMAYELDQLNIYFKSKKRTKVCKNSDQCIRATLGKPFTSNCSLRKATGNHLNSSATSPVYDGNHELALEHSSSS